MSSSNKRPAPGVSHRKPSSKDDSTAPTSRKIELKLEDEQLLAGAKDVLVNQEKLIWIANDRQDSVAQTELYFTKLLHRPHEKQPTQTEPLFQDARYGEKVPEAVRKHIKQSEVGGAHDEQTRADKPRKAGNSQSKGKAKDGKIPTRESENRLKRFADKMDIDVEEDEEETENDQGGVPINTSSY